MAQSNALDNQSCCMAEQKIGGYSTMYRYTGKEPDPMTGLSYFGARYYDPQLSMWYVVEPMAEEGLEYSAYVYTFNNPIVLKDPDGNWPDPPTWLKEAAANTTAFVAGAVNAASSNMLMGAGRGNPNDFGNYAQAAEYGQTEGDLVSAAFGVIEAAVGIVGDGAAVALAILTGGASTIAIPLADTAVIHGGTTTITALKNLTSPSRVQANSNQGNGVRSKNKLPDSGGLPNGTLKNKPDTTIIKYNSEGKVTKEFNKGHKDHPKNSKNYKDHIHDYKRARDKSYRRPTREPKKNEILKDFNCEN